MVWNFPIDVSFSATNAHGWPRMVLSVYGLDILGRDVVQGYGQLHIPTTPGVYTRYVRMFKPVSLSWAQQLTSWIFGNQAEFYDSKFVVFGWGALPPTPPGFWLEGQSVPRTPP